MLGQGKPIVAEWPRSAMGKLELAPEAPHDRRMLAMPGFRDVNIANYGPDGRGTRRVPPSPSATALLS